MMNTINNPFRPGAGHRPPYLAGRTQEKDEFRKLIGQDIILNNLIMTGLRGVGKTVLLDEFKDIAQHNNWQWAGTDCSESASVTEDTIALRIITDVALVTSGIVIDEREVRELGFVPSSAVVEKRRYYMDFQFLVDQYRNIPGLPIDKLKRLLMMVWDVLKDVDGFEGIVFAYDEAQTLSDHAESQQYPLSVLLDLFQYLQKSGARFLLVLTGLPTLLTKLVETRTYTERLFHVIVLDQLNVAESREAIMKPVENTEHRDKFSEKTVQLVVEQSGGYPYFIQFICREIYDAFTQKEGPKQQDAVVPIDAIIQKLDSDFFAGRWSRATDRERELMIILAESGKSEFTLQEAALLSEQSAYNSFSASLVSQFFGKLIEKGLIYKDRRGVYLFAVPLLAQYILRTERIDAEI